LNGTQNRRTEIRTETTQDDVKQEDRNGQNIQFMGGGGHRSERPEPDMKEKRTGLVIEFFLPLNGTQNRLTEIRTETTQDDVKQDRNGQNIQFMGGGRS
jgi:hypothetical protein